MEMQVATGASCNKSNPFLSAYWSCILPRLHRQDSLFCRHTPTNGECTCLCIEIPHFCKERGYSPFRRNDLRSHYLKMWLSPMMTTVRIDPSYGKYGTNGKLTVQN